MKTHEEKQEEQRADRTMKIKSILLRNDSGSLFNYSNDIN